MDGALQPGAQWRTISGRHAGLPAFNQPIARAHRRSWLFLEIDGGLGGETPVIAEFGEVALLAVLQDNAGF
jgi:hypothetical protein